MILPQYIKLKNYNHYLIFPKKGGRPSRSTGSIWIHGTCGRHEGVAELGHIGTMDPEWDGLAPWVKRFQQKNQVKNGDHIRKLGDFTDLTMKKWWNMWHDLMKIEILAHWIFGPSLTHRPFCAEKKTSFGKIQWEFQWLRRLRWWFACPQGIHWAKTILTNQRGSGTSDPCHPRSHQSILYPSGCGVSFESYAIHLVIPSLPHNV